MDNELLISLNKVIEYTPKIEGKIALEKSIKKGVMSNRVTSDNITELKPNEIFVFGSNEAGRHGKGAAKFAMRFGAKYGVYFGMEGNTFAIPTKDENIKTLPIDEIKRVVDLFLEYVRRWGSRYIFLVTPIGCGLAGYSPEEIAPLFEEAVNIDNIHLPECFWDVLNKK